MKERMEPLGGGITAFVTESHGFGTDAVLLAHFAAPSRRDTCCDLGTGCGIIPLLWCRQPVPAQIAAVELQPEACRLVTRAVEENKLEGRLHVVNADLRRLDGVLAPASFSLVTMNPPYQPVGAGIPSQSKAELLARHEVACTVEDVAQAAARLLRPGGRFALCHRPHRLFDAMEAMRRAGVEPKRLRFVSDRAALQPFLFLLEGKKGANPGLMVLPQLLLHKEDGARTEEIIKITGYAGEGAKA